MAVIPQYTLPKGNQGMTLFGTRNDDSTVTLPTLEFSFLYNNTSVNTIFSSGNSWIGLGAGTEHISINRRDASYNNLFYANEMEYGLKVFRMRFEGNSSYSSWGSNDLIWEFSVFEDGVMRLIIEKTPNNASDNFNNPGGTVLAVRFETGKSYIFTSQNENGTNFIVEEGTYLPCQSKFLFIDEEGVKFYLQTEELNVWSKVADEPMTEAIFIEYGVDVLTSETGGRIRIAISVDNGVSYKTFSRETSSYVPINIDNMEEFLLNGIRASELVDLDYAVLNQMVGETLNFAYVLEKPTLNDICKLKAVKIRYEE